MRVRHPRRCRPRAGFTLVEVVVALAVAGVVLLAARQMLEALAAHAGRVSTSAERADRDANADRLLRGLVGGLEVGTSAAGEFEGQERVARFTSWCDVPAGWQERCEVTLAFDSTADDGNVLAVRLAGTAASGTPWSRATVVRRGFDAGALRYLGDAGQGGTWFRAWGRGITAPLAIAVILVRAAPSDTTATPVHADTLIVRIGERG